MLSPSAAAIVLAAIIVFVVWFVLGIILLLKWEPETNAGERTQFVLSFPVLFVVAAAVCLPALLDRRRVSRM